MNAYEQMQFGLNNLQSAIKRENDVEGLKKQLAEITKIANAMHEVLTHEQVELVMAKLNAGK